MSATPASPWTYRAVVALLLVVAAGALVLAVRSSDTGSTDRARHESVERLIPAPGSQEVRQARVGVDLAPGWDAELFVNGRAIPRDQTEGWEAGDASPERSLFQVLFQPGPDKEFELFPAGEICVTAQIFSLVSDETAVEDWCFTAI